MHSITSRFHQVSEQIERVASAAGRAPGSVRLVVVTKGHPLESIQEVIEAGALRLGENYVEEGVQKIVACAANVEWHMIGHVQSRKAREVCEYFHTLHSLDNLKLANRLERFCTEQGRRLPVLLECNVSGEETKFGFSAWDEPAWESMLPAVESIVQLPHLEVRGLMTMAPFFDEAEPARPYFRKLRRLQSYLQQNFPQTRWEELSMGMSGDYEVAIQEGATLLRIGTAVMGPRPVRPSPETVR